MEESYGGLPSKGKNSDAADNKFSGEGDCTRQQYVDQFKTSEEDPQRESFEGTRFLRGPKVREAVLIRSGGICEFCGEKGFLTKAGSIYLETHHIVPLSEAGLDNPESVIGLCPKYHRESRNGADSKKLRKLMSDTVRSKALT